MNKVALITGASRGIGKAIAMRLAKNGFDIAIVGRNAERLKSVQGEIEKIGASCTSIEIDIAMPSAAQDIINAVVSKFSRIDVLVNNAGLAYSMSIADTSMEVWDSIFSINARAPYFLCKESIPVLKESPKPIIINIGSVVDFKGYPNQSVYASSKHALAGFTKVLAKEVQELGIKVHLISPGGVNTEMVQEMRPDINTENLIHPEEIAELVEFLVNRKGKGTVDHLYIRRQNGLAFD